MFRQLLREFIVEQLFYFVNKLNQVTMSIYDGGLSLGVCDKGYHATYHKYVKIAKDLSWKQPTV